MDNKVELLMSIVAFVFGAINTFFGNQIRRNLKHFKGEDVRTSTRWYLMYGYLMFYGGICAIAYASVQLFFYIKEL